MSDNFISIDKQDVFDKIIGLRNYVEVLKHKSGKLVRINISLGQHNRCVAYVYNPNDCEWHEFFGIIPTLMQTTAASTMVEADRYRLLGVVNQMLGDK